MYKTSTAYGRNLNSVVTCAEYLCSLWMIGYAMHEWMCNDRIVSLNNKVTVRVPGPGKSFSYVGLREIKPTSTRIGVKTSRKTNKDRLYVTNVKYLCQCKARVDSLLIQHAMLARTRHGRYVKAGFVCVTDQITKVIGSFSCARLIQLCIRESHISANISSYIIHKYIQRNQFLLKNTIIMCLYPNLYKE